MTVEQEVDALTTAVDNLKSTVVLKKATLDASVVDAQSAASQTQSAKTAALSARDQANASKDAALGYAASAASAVAYQDLTALAESKAVTAVDVFIYDTSKDSDGGAWRHRCTGTSWYSETLNTATRGARREFPAVAVIVAEVQKVTIYDGDDPSLPMWMVFTPSAAPATPQIWRGGRNATSVAALNGTVGIGITTDGQGGLVLMDLLADIMLRYSGLTDLTGGISVSQRNNPVTTPILSSQKIVNYLVNDVAMTVLPDAPVDPATGLPVPTIAVATDGGVSVIKDDGTVVDIVGAYGASKTGFFGEEVLFHRSRIVEIGPIPDADTTEAAFDRVTYWYNGAVQLPLARNFTGSHVLEKPLIYNGGVAGLATLLDDETGTNSGPEGSMVAYTTSTYNTGWMPGAIKGAFLSDTDDTDLVASGELVTNGDFATDSDWTKVEFSISGGVAVPNSSATTCTLTQYNLGMVNGGTYILEFDVSGRTVGNIYPRAGSFSNLATLNSTANGTHTYTFVSSSDLIQFVTNSGFDGTIDNISVKLADADRSVNANGLIVNGTVTRSPVATGADLVAYSGFSASNYLEQPYNPDLDFGTGDFCYMGWLTSGSTPLSVVFSRGDGTQTTTNDAVVGGISSSGTLLYRHYNASGTLVTNVSGTTNVALGTSVWKHFAIVRKDGVIKLYVDGAEDTLQSNTNPSAPVSGTTSPKFAIGKSIANIWPTNSFGVGGGASSIALLRISATAPTAEQIAKIYNDEKVLFQENAACTLYGASDAVTALAHDSDTGLLHVGTSAGRSVFKGLRRVSNTTTAVGTAISAVNGMVVEE